MTLDEAIKHAEETAEENQRVIDTGIIHDDVTIDMLYCDDTEVIEEHLANYQRCAEAYRQLAEWLRELKKLKEQEPCEDIKEYYKEIWDCDINHPKYEDTVAEIVEKSYVSGYIHGVENRAKEFGFELEQEPKVEKIRTEIEQITDTMGVSYNQYISKKDVLQILDKYRESEE